MKTLPPGKIPIRILSKTMLNALGRPSSKLVSPPRPGLDFGVIKLDKGFMVISADPVTGVSSEVGYHAIQVGANDVATSGNRPQFAESVVLLPENSRASDVAEIGKEINRGAKELGISVVGGHTEVTPGLNRPIVMMTVFSFVKGYVSSGGASAGDTILMTGTAGIEGTAVLAKESRKVRRVLDKKTLEKAAGYVSRLSVVDEAVRAFETGHVRAMHDCTEGGLVGAAFEMSLASGVGFEFSESAVPVARETKQVCEVLGVDPLRLIGSGSLILAVKPGNEDDVASALRGICRVSKIGRFTSRGRLLRKRDGSVIRVSEAPEDELWRVLENPR